MSHRACMVTLNGGGDMKNVQFETGDFVLVCDDCECQLTADSPGRVYWTDNPLQEEGAARLCDSCYSWRQRGFLEALEEKLFPEAAA